MFDARISSGDPCAAWKCPIDREPPTEWWTQPNPCPDGGTLHFVFAPDRSMTRAGVGVRCELAGQPHGATTNWVLTEQQWFDETGWYEHGKPCAAWHDVPVAVPPPDTDHHFTPSN